MKAKSAFETRIGTVGFTHIFENSYTTAETVDLLFNPDYALAYLLQLEITSK